MSWAALFFCLFHSKDQLSACQKRKRGKKRPLDGHFYPFVRALVQDSLIETNPAHFSATQLRLCAFKKAGTDKK